jgi:general secretion pathway protein C
MAWRLSAFDRDRRAESAARLCCVLFGLVALWLLVRLAWVLLPAGDAVLDTAAVPLASGTEGSRVLSASKWHLFGSTSQPAGSVASAAPATTLSMILRGTVAERDPRAGIAVIADEHGVERAWRAGETLAAGVRLAEIHPDHVVLVHDGIEEVLRLPRDQTDTAMAPARAAVPRATARGSAAPTGARTYTPPEMAHGAAGDWQRTVRELRAQDASGLAEKLQVLPVFEDGKLRGVRLTAAGDASLITKLGLRPTDVVTAINGTPLDDLSRGQQVVQGLRNAASANVTVLRDGQPTQIHVTLR